MRLSGIIDELSAEKNLTIDLPPHVPPPDDNQVFIIFDPEKQTYQLPVPSETIPPEGKDFTFDTPTAKVIIKIPDMEQKKPKVIVKIYPKEPDPQGERKYVFNSYPKETETEETDVKGLKARRFTFQTPPDNYTVTFILRPETDPEFPRLVEEIIFGAPGRNITVPFPEPGATKPYFRLIFHPPEAGEEVPFDFPGIPYEDSPQPIKQVEYKSPNEDLNLIFEIPDQFKEPPDDITAILVMNDPTEKLIYDLPSFTLPKMEKPDDDFTGRTFDGEDDENLEDGIVLKTPEGVEVILFPTPNTNRKNPKPQVNDIEFDLVNCSTPVRLRVKLPPGPSDMKPLELIPIPPDPDRAVQLMEFPVPKDEPATPIQTEDGTVEFYLPDDPNQNVRIKITPKDCPLQVT
jgi:hypothetical protein